MSRAAAPPADRVRAPGATRSGNPAAPGRWLRAALLCGALGAVASSCRPAVAAPGAPDAARLAAADRLLTDMGGGARLDAVLTAMRGLLVQIVQRHGQDAAGAARTVDELLLPAMRAHLPELRVSFAQVWAGGLTTAEMDGADAFYRSPLGRRMVEAQARALPAIVLLSQGWGRRVAQEIIAQHRAALRQRGVSL